MLRPQQQQTIFQDITDIAYIHDVNKCNIVWDKMQT
ncbi:hypothetical protein SPLC1_S033800 [Arthrospira platensis C1]|nr:hypothetical protein SPLC1_S033800 [Arthrospira platensis C1]